MIIKWIYNILESSLAEKIKIKEKIYKKFLFNINNKKKK